MTTIGYNLTQTEYRKIFLSLNDKNETILSSFLNIETNDNYTIDLLDLIANFNFTSDEIFNNLQTIGNNLGASSVFIPTKVRTAFFNVASQRTLRINQALINFANKTLSRNQIRFLLTIKNEINWVTLHATDTNYDENIFSFYSEVYKNYFTTDEIRKILMDERKPGAVNFPDYIFIMNKPKKCEDIAKFLEEIFKNHDEDLKKYFAARDSTASTIFTDCPGCRHKKMCIKYFVEVADKIYKSETEKKEFKKLLKVFDKFIYEPFFEDIPDDAGMMIFTIKINFNNQKICNFYLI